MRHFFTCASPGMHDSTAYAMQMRENATNDIWGRVTCAQACVWYDRVRYASLEVPELHIHRCSGRARADFAMVRGRSRSRTFEPIFRSHATKRRWSDNNTSCLLRFNSLRCRSWRCTSRRSSKRSMLDQSRPLAGNHFVRFQKLVRETPTTAD